MINFDTPSSPHLHGPSTVRDVMLKVIYALIPAIVIYAGLFGWGVIINILIASITALVSEAIMLKLRDRPVGLFLNDGSALLTAVLLGMALPPLSPWWLIVVGTAFAMVFAKHLYGGLGYNPFNPAMVGYVMLLISFPREMTMWPAPLTVGDVHLGLFQSLSYVFSGSLPSGINIDALTTATPLDTLKTQRGLGQTVQQITATHPVYGLLGGSGWEWVNLALLAGGCWLIYKKIIGWQVPVALIGTLFVIALFFYMIDAQHFASPLLHVFSGATILGAFFIATDPVSGATTVKGRLVFGAGVAILTYVIRHWGGYPDAIAFAVLLMNMAAPTIDYYTKPRVFGHGGACDGD